LISEAVEASLYSLSLFYALVTCGELYAPCLLPAQYLLLIGDLVYFQVAARIWMGWLLTCYVSETVQDKTNVATAQWYRN